MTLKELIDKCGGIRYQAQQEGIGTIEIRLGYEAFVLYMMNQDYWCTVLDDKMVLRTLEEYSIH